MKHFAFLDVDQTLIYNNRDVNRALLQSLKEKKVSDIFLFTNMDLKDIKRVGLDAPPMSRAELVVYLTTSGFTVHGVISSADTGYHDERGVIKPVGSAYKELYDPLMRRVQSDKGLTAETWADFWLAEAAWINASLIASKKKEIGPLARAEIKLAAPFIKLKPGCDPAMAADLLVGPATRDSLIAFFAKTPEERRSHYVEFDDHPEHSLTVNGDHCDDNKAGMMQLAIGQLIQTYGPIAITFFDDKKSHLDTSKESVRLYEDAGLLYLKTHLISTDYAVSQSPASKAGYDQALDISLIFTHAAETITRTMAMKRGFCGFFGIWDQLTLAAPLLPLPFATSQHMLNFARIAQEGSHPLFASASSITAFKCLCIAYLKAANSIEKIAAESEICSFLTTHTYDSTQNKNQVDDPRINQILTGLRNLPRYYAQDSSIARTLGEKYIELQRLISGFLAPESKAFQEVNATIRWYEDILKDSEQPRIQLSTRASAHSSESFFFAPGSHAHFAVNSSQTPALASSSTSSYNIQGQH